MPNIGEVLAQEEKNAAPQPEIGQALTGQSLVPNQQQTEMMKSPQFAQMKQWIQKPENLMTSLVFLASLAQNRRQGQSPLAALGERAVGSLAFRHELGRSQRDEVRLQEEEARRQQAITQQGEYQQGQLGVARDQVAATRENTMADRTVAENQIRTQQQMNTQDNMTDLQIAEMNRRLGEFQSQMSLRASQTRTPFIGDAELKAATDIMTAANEMGKSMVFQEALLQVLRPKMLLDPSYSGLLTIMDAPPPANPANPAPIPATAKPKNRPQPKSLPAAEQRRVNTQREVETARKVGGVLGEQTRRLGETQNRPKEKF
jgi:hypothetical protein